MAEISRSHVTITLGRGGQVVKRAGLSLDVDIPSLHHAAGTKRSVKDRLGLGSGEDAGQPYGKRQRTDNDRSSHISSNGFHDNHLGKNDLRFKLMKKKSVLRRFQTDVQHDGMDLREKLSRSNQASLVSPSYHERTPNRRDTWYEADAAQYSLTSQSFHEITPNKRDTRYKLPYTARDSFGSPDFCESMPERRDTRYTVPNTASLDRACFHESMPERRDIRYKVPDPTRASLASPSFRESLSERRETRYTVAEAARSSLSSPNFRESMSERRNTRYKVPEAARPSLARSRFRESMSERRDSRYTVADASRSSLASPSFRESMPERRVTRYTLRNTARASMASPSFRERMPERRDTRYTVPDTRTDNEFGKFSSKRSSDSLYQGETLRNNYSPLRERSPARDLRGTRNHENSAKRSPTRTYEVSRTVPYISNDIHVIDPGSLVRSSPYITRPVVAMTNGKPASSRLPSSPPLEMGIISRNSYLGIEHTSVEGLLKSLGLEKYTVPFKAEEIDIATLKQMGDGDLKDLGIPVGPRTQILLALLPETKREL